MDRALDTCKHPARTALDHPAPVPPLFPPPLIAIPLQFHDDRLALAKHNNHHSVDNGDGVQHVGLGLIRPPPDTVATSHVLFGRRRRTFIALVSSIL